MAGAVDYQLPVWYPEGGINGFLYFKRIRANLAFGYARYRNLKHSGWDSVNSYGGEVFFDVNWMRVPAVEDTSVSISIFKPSDRNGVVVGFGFSLPI